MNDLVQLVAQQFNALSLPELVAVVLAIAYLLLAIRQNIWCWPCAAMSTAIYVLLFFQARLYMEALLNVFYFGMAVYGWWVWRGGVQHQQPPVTVWPFRWHVAAISAIVVASLGTGRLLTIFTDAAYPYVDSMTTFAAIWATFLVARKVLENWWYWLLIDAVSVVIYWNRGLELTSILFAVYVVMIPFGLLAWNRSRAEAGNLAPA